jgi:predicted ester cyclase
MSTSDLLHQWYDQVWNKANAAFIDEMMHKDVIVHGLDPSGTAKGIQFFKTFYNDFRTTFPTVNVDLKHLVSDAESSTVQCSVTARSANGKEVSFSGLSVARFDKDHKLVEGWNNFDFLKMYQQLGHILVAQIEEK